MSIKDSQHLLVNREPEGFRQAAVPAVEDRTRLGDLQARDIGSMATREAVAGPLNIPDIGISPQRLVQRVREEMQRKPQAA
jgi:hypothetical protein